MVAIFDCWAENYHEEVACSGYLSELQGTHGAAVVPQPAIASRSAVCPARLLLFSRAFVIRSRSGIVAAAACLITGSTRVRRSSVQRASAVAVGHTPVHGRAERVGRLLHLLRRLQLQGHAHRAHARLPAGCRQRWATSGRAALCDAGSSRGLTGCEATRRGLVRGVAGALAAEHRIDGDRRARRIVASS